VTDPRTKAGLEAIRVVVEGAAREAAFFVKSGYRRELMVERKGPVDLVTRFDRESETLIRARLAEKLPFPVVGEEQGGATDGAAFYVDPLDGTTNFVHGHPFWCVSIGLVAGGIPVLGVVVSPPLGLEWSGWVAEDGERWCVRRTAHDGPDAPNASEVPCRVSPTDQFEDALLATGFPYDRRTSEDNNFDAFVVIKRKCQAVRRCGSAALDLCLVADATYEGYWERKLRSWDIAGGSAIVRAAGGRVTDFDGGPAFLPSGHIVATNGVLHDALLSELAYVASTKTPQTTTT
jgi:myo-inositol-1(or 4)-monophosphatase